MTYKTTLAGALILLASGCGPATPDGEISVTEHGRTSVDPEIAAQNRINSFLYVAVVPRLQPCWSGVQGQGEIAFRYTFRRSGTTWVWQQQEVESSTLPTDQQPIALRCMEEAVRDTSFPLEAAEAAREGAQFVLDWTWPVPLPQDLTALGRMINPGGGGGECKKSCVSCSCPFTPGAGVTCSCATSCSGYTSPCTVHPDQKGCDMRLPACATGRIGGGGGIVIARAD